MAEPLPIETANRELELLSAADRIQWAVERLGESVVLLSSMQKTASVLMHMFHRLGLDNEVLFCDTGFHFHETLHLRDEFMRRYHLNILTLYPEMTPEQQESRFGRKLYLYADGYPECCRLRKELPFIRHMRAHSKQLAIIGARRADGGRRSRLEPITFDPRIGGYAFHPIFDWTDEIVEDYVQRHQVPVHALHAQGYPSIGCACCTTPVTPGEDPRAGRWRHLRDPNRTEPLFCGINFTDGSGI